MLGIGNIFAKSSFIFTPRIGNYSIHRSGTSISFYLQPHYLVAHNVSFPPLIRAAEARRQLQRGFVPGGIKGINMTHKCVFRLGRAKVPDIVNLAFITILPAINGSALRKFPHFISNSITCIKIRGLSIFFSPFYRPQTKFAKVMFLHVSVILPTGGGCYPSMPCRFPGPHPWEKLRGMWPGGSPGPQPRVKLRGDLARGGLQAHTQGWSWGGSGRGGTCFGGGLLGGVPAPGRGVETPRADYCCGRYASYWNAFF